MWEKCCVHDLYLKREETWTTDTARTFLGSQEAPQCFSQMFSINAPALHFSVVRKKSSVSAIPSPPPYQPPSPTFLPSLFFSPSLLTQRYGASVWHHMLITRASQNKKKKKWQENGFHMCFLLLHPLSPFSPFQSRGRCVWKRRKRQIGSSSAQSYSLLNPSFYHPCVEGKERSSALFLPSADWGNGNWISVKGHSPSSRHRFGLAVFQSAGWRSIAWEHPASPDSVKQRTHRSEHTHHTNANHLSIGVHITGKKI